MNNIFPKCNIEKIYNELNEKGTVELGGKGSKYPIIVIESKEDGYYVDKTRSCLYNLVNLIIDEKTSEYIDLNADVSARFIGELRYIDDKTQIRVESFELKQSLIMFKHNDRIIIRSYKTRRNKFTEKTYGDLSWKLKWRKDSIDTIRFPFLVIIDRGTGKSYIEIYDKLYYLGHDRDIYEINIKDLFHGSDNEGKPTYLLNFGGAQIKMQYSNNYIIVAGYFRSPLKNIRDYKLVSIIKNIIQQMKPYKDSILLDINGFTREVINKLKKKSIQKYFILTGSCLNVLKSLYDLLYNQRRYFLWGFKRKSTLDRIDIGDIVYVYATDPIQGIILRGKVVNKIDLSKDPSKCDKYWPEDAKSKKGEKCDELCKKWCYRIEIEPDWIAFKEVNNDFCDKNKFKEIQKALEDYISLEDIRDIYVRLRKIKEESKNKFTIQGYRKIDKEIARELDKLINYLKQSQMNISMENFKERVLNKLVLDEELVELIYNLLDSGENILLVGPPGVGKTLLAHEVALARGYEPYYVVATAHWSRHDLIGGLMFGGKNVIWRSGHLIRALVKHIENKQEHSPRKSPHGVYLIIDEVNRADVDKAFSEFFTIFSSHNPEEHLIPCTLVEEIKEYVEEGKADNIANEFINYVNERLFEAVYTDGKLIGYRVPEDFRIIAIMNTVDVRNLFIVGEAFARRFAIVEVNAPKDIDNLLNKIYKNIQEELYNELTEEEINEIQKLINNKLKEIYLKFYEKYEKREIPIIYSPSALYLTIKTFIKIYKQKIRHDKEVPKKVDVEMISSILNKCIEISLPLSRLWDRKLREKIDEVLEIVNEKTEEVREKT